jgi:hypothetical protein
MGTEQQQQTDAGGQQQTDSDEQSYDDDALVTTTLPGSGGTVSGTAVTDWVDDKDKGNIETSAEEGKVEFRKTDEFKKKQEE